MATQKLAKALKAEGFKVFARRLNPNAPAGKLRKPTLKWIREHLSNEQAGLILRQLRGKPTSSWETVLPARPFVTVDREQARAALKKELTRGR
ncbi:hypothetical protein BS333_14930 [Vibrio azureus]|uniref:Uncharacterized protein n=1 Tax=Vibrio sagamiensis NBRC 104589 TaxID=1219064 RepID=A0A511QJ52_9VIBR|nr:MULTISPECIES: hypothetical protein [Vibrio harveyi group]AUI87698.1 hypothetical protein BS333_14930 [Vibrio azureus]PNQ69316.1 hypothetical protein C1141_06295 [Vibrio agarivorans]GEM77360.1 hypothetical protein VSA01S_34720 [Vibrio sagamiensis NBRC 104589]